MHTDNFTPNQHLQCLLAFLDDVIAKDEARTQGEWEIYDASSGERCFLDKTGNALGSVRKFSVEWEPESDANAAHIAIGSISQGRNARALKQQLAYLMDAAAKLERSISDIVSIYPDEILRRYLK